MKRIFGFVLTAVLMAACVLDQEPRSLIQAIPTDAVVILKSGSTSNFFSELESTVWYAESDSSQIVLSAVKKLLVIREALFGDQRPELESILSIHRSGATSYDYLLSLNETTFIEALKGAEIDLLGLGEVTGKTYEGVRIEHVQNVEKKIDLYFFNAHGLVLFSSSELLAESAVRHLNQETSLLDDSQFMYVYDKANKKEDAQFFIQFSELPDIVGKYIGTKEVEWTGRISRWMEIDLDIKEDRLLGSGLLVSSDTAMNYLNVFSKSPAQAVQVQRILPRNTAILVDFGVENFKTYQRDFKKYLHRYNREEALSKLETNEALYGAFTSWVDNEFALCITETEKTDLSENTYAIVRARDVDLAIEKLMQVDDPTKRTNYRDHEIGFVYHRVLPTLLGAGFRTLKHSWFVALNDYVVFAHSEASLKVFINDFVAGRTLSKSDKFNSRFAELSVKSNVFMYADNPKALRILRGILDQGLLRQFDDRVYPALESIDGIALQLKVEKNAAFAQLLIEYKQQDENDSRMLWMVELDTAAIGSPHLLKNHYTRQNEILVQDVNNSIYQYSPDGELLWKKPIKGTIQGEVHQVDMFRNGKLQLVFNTDQMIYVLDRNGEDVEPWPIHTPSKSTAPMAVFDYDNRRAYRLLVPCGTKILNYDLDGNLVQGWAFNETNSDVTHQPQLFQLAGKDFVVFREFNGTVSILNRKGEVRLPIEEELDLTENPFFMVTGKSLADSRMICSDEGGNLVSIFFNGNIDRLDMEELQPSHELIVSNDHYYILNNDVLDIQGPEMNHSIELGGRASWMNVIQIGGQDYPAVVLPENKQAMLFYEDELFEGMPMFGDSPFIVKDLKKNGQHQLVILDSDGILYSYLLDI